MNPTRAASDYLNQLRALVDRVDAEEIGRIAGTLYGVCRKGGTVFVCGNGGSASTASHMACDLSKNVTTSDHNRLRVVSLTDNLAHFSAIANDLGYENVFVEQLRNLMSAKDALVAISASGNSPNVVRAAQFALDLGAPVIAMTGFGGGVLREMGTASLHVDCPEYGPVEDLHLVFNHLLVVALRALVEGE